MIGRGTVRRVGVAWASCRLIYGASILYELVDDAKSCRIWSHPVCDVSLGLQMVSLVGIISF